MTGAARRCRRSSTVLGPSSPCSSSCSTTRSTPAASVRPRSASSPPSSHGPAHRRHPVRRVRRLQRRPGLRRATDADRTQQTPVPGPCSTTPGNWPATAPPATRGPTATRSPPRPVPGSPVRLHPLRLAQSRRGRPSHALRAARRHTGRAAPALGPLRRARRPRCWRGPDRVPPTAGYELLVPAPVSAGGAAALLGGDLRGAARPGRGPAGGHDPPQHLLASRRREAVRGRAAGASSTSARSSGSIMSSTRS